MCLYNCSMYVRELRIVHARHHIKLTLRAHFTGPVPFLIVGPVGWRENRQIVNQDIKGTVVPPKSLTQTHQSRLMEVLSKPACFATLLIRGGIVSMAVSAWQYQVVDNHMLLTNGATGHFVSLTDFCNQYKWMRPFRLTVSGHEDAGCGYSEANTYFRLSLAFLTVLGGCLLHRYHKNMCNDAIHRSLLCGFCVWSVTGVVDTLSVVQGHAACTASMEKYDNRITCDYSLYSITIVTDIVMCVVLYLCWSSTGTETALGVCDDSTAAAAESANVMLQEQSKV